ncbi:MAG: sugar phosphate isomerase/epimerase [Candidatus Anstonellales archaeon]|uniref:sugar phosphate isomerase/epimerase family protein n=1 Tax=Rosettibacter primus TaxID=3111523 RepID=UPI003171FD17
MKIGFLTACLPSLSLEEIVRFASKSGFKALELAAWPSDSSRDYQARQIEAEKFSKDDAERVKELFAKNNLEISAMAYYDNNFHPDTKQREFFHNHLRKVIDVASMLNVKLVGTFVGGNPDLTPKENIKAIGRIFNELVKYAADRNVCLMIENCPMENWVKFGLPGNYAYSPELWLALFNEIQADNFGLNFDPSHLLWLGIDYLKAVKDFAPKIFHAHAKDTEILHEGIYQFGIYGKQIDPIPWKSGWWRYRIPGLGKIDWKSLISTLQENGYDKYLSIEHEDPVWEGNIEKIKYGLKLGLKHLSQYVI